MRREITSRRIQNGVDIRMREELEEKLRMAQGDLYQVQKTIYQKSIEREKVVVRRKELISKIIYIGYTIAYLAIGLSIVYSVLFK